MTTEEVMFKNLEHKIRLWILQQEKTAETAPMVQNSEEVLLRSESNEA